MEAEAIAEVDLAQHLEQVGGIAGLVGLEGETAVPVGEARGGDEVAGLTGQGLPCRIDLSCAET